MSSQCSYFYKRKPEEGGSFLLVWLKHLNLAITLFLGESARWRRLFIWMGLPIGFIRPCLLAYRSEERKKKGFNSARPMFALSPSVAKHCLRSQKKTQPIYVVRLQSVSSTHSARFSRTYAAKPLSFVLHLFAPKAKEVFNSSPLHKKDLHERGTFSFRQTPKNFSP